MEVCLYVCERVVITGRKSNELVMYVWDLSATPMRPDNLLIYHLSFNLSNTQ